IRAAQRPGEEAGSQIGLTGAVCARTAVTAERRAVRSVEEQQTRVSAAAVAPRPVRVAIAEAQGLMCAEEVVTERPLPGFDQAAIDGYAVRSVDVLGVGTHDGGSASDDGSDSDDDRNREVSLPVMGSIEAGARQPSRLQPRQGARRQTGAASPPARAAR